MGQAWTLTVKSSHTFPNVQLEETGEIHASRLRGGYEIPGL